MKKLFNRTKRPVQKWEDYDESEFDWDGLEQDGEEADVLAEDVPAEEADADYFETEYSDEGHAGSEEDETAIDYAESEYSDESYAGMEEDEAAADYTESEYTDEGHAGVEEDEAAADYAEPEYMDESYAGVEEDEAAADYAEPEYVDESYAGVEEDEAAANYAEPEYMDESYVGVEEDETAGYDMAPGDTVCGNAGEYGEAPAELYSEEIESAGEGDWPEEDETAAFVGGEEILEEAGLYEDDREAETDLSYESGRPGKKEKKNSGKPFGRLAHTQAIDRLILGTGVAVLVLAIVTGGIYIFSRVKERQISAFSTVGTQLDHIDMIGETGLLAVADARLAKLETADIVSDSQQEEEEDQDPDYQEEEYKREVHVVMEFVSIQEDLKIKFVNEKTGKLVANVPFSVNVTAPDGKKLFWSDDDMDGVIYKKDIAAGSYTVAMEPLADERYADFTVSSRSQTAEVKKEIVYKKVEVANEIKSEDEVNVAQEDTRKNETQVESTLQDTVEWVESSVLEASYSEVPKSSIPDPMTYALDKRFIRSAGTVSPPDTGRARLTVSFSPAAVSVAQGGTAQVDTIASGSGEALKYSLDLSAGSSGQAAKAEIDASTGRITITGTAPGTEKFTVRVNYADGNTDTEGSAELTVTVTPAPTLTLDKTAATAYVGEPLILNVTASGTASAELKAVSQDALVASVSVSGTAVTVTGLKAGTTNITVSLAGNESVQAVCVVTVKDNPKSDRKSLLKDASGHPLYVQENGEYREAVYADYYVETNKFYLRTEARYTGWQNLDGKVYYFTATGEKVVGEQVIQGAKYQFASDGSLVTGTGTLGIDVSKWNGAIDWNEVKKSGVGYVIIRCGYRGSSAGSLIEDPRFAANIKGATAAGLKVGVYFFTQAIDEREAVEEASMVLELVKNYTISYPIFLDVESSGGRADNIDRGVRTAVCKAFCQTIQNAGYTAGIYANKNWLENKIDAAALSGYKIWLAQYAGKPTYTGRYDMWQYRSDGSVGGIKGNVDMNLSYLGY